MTLHIQVRTFWVSTSPAETKRCGELTSLIHEWYELTEAERRTVVSYLLGRTGEGQPRGPGQPRVGCLMLRGWLRVVDALHCHEVRTTRKARMVRDAVLISGTTSSLHTTILPDSADGIKQ